MICILIILIKTVAAENNVNEELHVAITLISKILTMFIFGKHICLPHQRNLPCSAVCITPETPLQWTKQTIRTTSHKFVPSGEGEQINRNLAAVIQVPQSLFGISQTLWLIAWHFRLSLTMQCLGFNCRWVALNSHEINYSPEYTTFIGRRNCKQPAIPLV